MSEGENVYNYEGVDPKDKKKAQKELHENPDQVRAHIASLRRWVTSAPHLTCPTDDAFLLRFLRTAKFDQSRAQQLVDNFCTVRSSPRGSPEWFEPLRPDLPALEHYFTLPLGVLLGFNDDGEAVLYFLLSAYEPDMFPFEDFIRCMIRSSAERLLSDQRLQINGVRMLVDYRGAGQRHYRPWEDPKLLVRVLRLWQDALPMRNKAIIHYNESHMVDLLMKIFLPFLKEKVRRRIIRCGANSSKLKQAVGPGADRLLPPELGGQNRPMAELIADKARQYNSESAMQERRRLDQIRVDEALRPAATKNYLKSTEIDSTDSTSMGLTGTFTKLDVS
ncbi:hypothetical protein BOX15_Mlig010978g1 [Macrostomum lignano]|uniref:CRAL-TRIO domain-containing protein n=2 Tax=Macrostomum lignano TaxID=282301 RepID=A0A267EBH0_9PLAT|nr:hypothetical protein BOX15_Mlig010978g1 [Macrostomum lignano]